MSRSNVSGRGVYVPLPSAPRAFMSALARTPLGSVAGNARLTAATGLLLLVLLFVEGLTLPVMHRLFVVHTFVGWLLLPPIFLKLAGTGYRFVQYYTGQPEYRAAGPPQILLRLDAPFLIAATVGLFGSGIVLLAAGPGEGIWHRLHIVFFLFWFGVMTVHVLGHLFRALTLSWEDLASRGRGDRTGGMAGLLGRQSLVALTLLAGVLIAVATLPLNHSWVAVLS